jgi:hypothetical protein
VLEILKPYTQHGRHTSSSSSSSFTNQKNFLIFQKLQEYQKSQQIVNLLSSHDQKHFEHLEIIFQNILFTQKCIQILQIINSHIQKFYLSTISYRTVFQIKYQPEYSSYYYLRASVTSSISVNFSIIDPITNWFIQIIGNIHIMKNLCCQWNDSQKNGLSELIHAFQQSKNSLSKFIYRIKGSETSTSSGRIYCLSIRILPKHKTLLTIFDPILNDSLTFESTTEFHYIFRSNTRAMKMVCVGADIIQNYWETHFDSILISSIQEILGPHNTGNANTNLSTVLCSAKDNIRDSLRVLEQKCSLLLLTQIGFCFMNYSPWDLHWIDKLTIEDGIKVLSIIIIFFFLD